MGACEAWGEVGLKGKIYESLSKTDVIKLFMESVNRLVCFFLGEFF
jgi:hypothetical protein